MRNWMLAGLLVVFPALAESPNQYLRMAGFPQKGYISIPGDARLDQPAMTIEAWMSVRDAHSSLCSSVAGSGYVTGWWLGVCGSLLRSYFNGITSARTGGELSEDPEVWVHVAVVTDGSTRKHYINGALVFTGPESGLPASPQEIRIGSDPDWDFMAAGTLDDLRIWSTARTPEQILQTMYLRTVPNPSDVEFSSLEAWYRFEGNALDSWGTHHGTITGNGLSFETGQVIKVPGKRRAMARR